MFHKLAKLQFEELNAPASPRHYVDPPVDTEHLLDLAVQALALGGGPYAVIDGETMQAEYLVFEGQIWTQRGAEDEGLSDV